MNVSMREFQLHPKKYLSNLPIVLTVYGKPIAQVVKCVNTLIIKRNIETPALQNLPKVNIPRTVEEIKVPKPKASLGEIKYCKHFKPSNLCEDRECRGT